MPRAHLVLWIGHSVIPLARGLACLADSDCASSGAAMYCGGSSECIYHRCGSGSGGCPSGYECQWISAHTSGGLCYKEEKDRKHRKFKGLLKTDVIICALLFFGVAAIGYYFSCSCVQCLCEGMGMSAFAGAPSQPDRNDGLDAAPTTVVDATDGSSASAAQPDIEEAHEPSPQSSSEPRADITVESETTRNVDVMTV
mmetsp:Transcript_2567/g.7985  ORF Transcript_2567/g.7985 Transcript_2567/m.7985 type:complete len:198 (+) Transcript_2567:181-774(+)|eukprot:CAMPEP_0197397602 /NCGR_PEP_ID=MMETSP1165-20131217/11799_1 /TAXON_ID=284809 /ORGANISM="Chrysocystis fragilis, Strain CCMP3189" /LENGTH=197 /DNA_ID=CAMNT_0042923507 /DNA_START=78 /DNA_END=671 /DNA_ORIENTATION=+